jgi:septum formation protein
MNQPYPFSAGTRPIVLASGSPRRKQLMDSLGIDVEVVVPDIDESALPGEVASVLVERLAAAKATVVAATRPGTVIVAADTAVEVDADVLGKPADADDARRMLQRLSGRRHVVHTGVVVALGERMDTARTSTDVAFVRLSPSVIEWYLETGEALDKAGAYGLQGAGGAFVESVRGSVSGVLGLPLDVTVRLIDEALRSR